MAALNDVQIHNNKVLETLNRGDLVEFPGTVYSHWGVYVGDKEIIHRTVDENDGLSSVSNSGSSFSISSVINSKAIVKRESFLDVASGSKACRNNDKDKKMSPFSAEETVKRAEEKIDEKGYNALCGNCEHFATECRYGIPESDQAEVTITGICFAGLSACVTLIAYSAKVFVGSNLGRADNVKK